MENKGVDKRCCLHAWLYPFENYCVKSRSKFSFVEKNSQFLQYLMKWKPLHYEFAFNCQHLFPFKTVILLPSCNVLINILGNQDKIVLRKILKKLPNTKWNHVINCFHFE